MFIYTFVFVSGVVVGETNERTFRHRSRSFRLATILPDLAGHHFKQPYGKEYGQSRSFDRGAERERERERMRFV